MFMFAGHTLLACRRRCTSFSAGCAVRLHRSSASSTLGLRAKNLQASKATLLWCRQERVPANEQDASGQTVGPSLRNDDAPETNGPVGASPATLPEANTDASATDADVETTGSDGRANVRRDRSRLAALVTSFGIMAALIRVEWVEHNTIEALWIVFCTGYAGIILEDILEFHKAGAALLMAVASWTALALAAPGDSARYVNSVEVTTAIRECMADVAPLLFFLLGAMSIVEIVDGHRGFRTVTDSIRTRNPVTLLWIISLITFFMSAILDNLTTTIVMVSILRQLVPPSARRLVGAAVVVAANCGGVATPLGDVTTTMLWIGGQITTVATIRDLLVPSFASLLVSVLVFSPMVAQAAAKDAIDPVGGGSLAGAVAPRGRLIFFSGVASLLFVPIFKAGTGLPPYMGMLLGLGFMWLLTDVLHAGEPGRLELRASRALARIDQSSILFFLGILMSVGALESGGALRMLAQWLDSHLAVRELIPTVIGLASSVIDNVPLVAATMGMYELSQHPPDSELWQLIAYCAGTGGSILIIGSAAGVAYMGMEKVGFFWYLRNASLAALAGYFAGILVYISLHGDVLQRLFHQVF
ncbi:similar to Na+/H+ antiporter [Cyanidioschyzon merolae strain 10D]|uniref:Similar to Na+/H+ antiporter n=1 Tax=Cyanidioschyzon merolae (strain NIES-3377 / 10D) TaxID=280699 RepID=M1V814_CYAM1|nr:similar to Na+/H+ antiporter [Cyanidioschyzon merolae strain 10D]BAM80229.1 similar to Na+/H+ antiporter [Cyanidioschyzon merolae strain 10D]|eukprot:XP_005534836.1 similar to Na+/H+ antiporter [Cyanidioschyzon merolae strain 10D]